jgi:hypothetical protein
MGDEEHMRRREFVRRHHPDHGGDPAVFIAGLRQFDGQAGSSRPRVVAVPHRAWLARLFLTLHRRRERAHRAPRVH